VSVHHRRFAAAKRTAAYKGGSRSRTKLMVTWLTIVAALTFFTFTLVASAANPEPDYASAVKELPEGEQFVVVGDHVCSVNRAQVSQFEALYEVGWMTVDVDGEAVDMVTVSGANEHEIRAVLEDARCKLVKRKRVFFLPFDAQTS
jgi:hypothetical protein